MHVARWANGMVVGPPRPPGPPLPRTRRDQHARSFDLDHTDPAHVHRVQRLEVAERRDRGTLLAAGVVDRRALGHVDRSAVDREGHGAPGRYEPDEGTHANSRRRLTADSTAL